MAFRRLPSSGRGRQDTAVRCASEASGWSAKRRNDVRRDGLFEPDRLDVRGYGDRQACEHRCDREQHHAQPACHHRARRRRLPMRTAGKIVRRRLLIERVHLHLAGHDSCAELGRTSDRRRAEHQRDNQREGKRGRRHALHWSAALWTGVSVRCRHRPKVGGIDQPAKMWADQVTCSCSIGSAPTLSPPAPVAAAYPGRSQRR